jgi:DNA-binding response OmpR family regulator
VIFVGPAHDPGRTIVVIEDDPTIADAVAVRLRSEGFHVVVAFDGPAGVDACADAHPDLVVLDLMLPGLDGLEVCRRIQADRPVPVVILTARDDETDLLVGLAVGADDYVTKPFSPRELMARIHAIFRRIDATTSAADVAAAPAPDPVLTVGDLRVDTERRRVWLGDDEVHLTPTEHDLLVCLARRPGTPRTRLHLLAEVWQVRDGSGARTVDSHVRALRRKLGQRVIRTHHGFGYSLDDVT